MNNKSPTTASDFDKALQFIKEGQYRQASEICGQLIDADPGNHRAYSLRGDCLFRLGEYARAFQDVERHIELMPSCPSSYWQRGMWHYYLGNDEQAIKDCTRVIDSADGFFLNVAYFLRALSYFNVGDKSKALQDCIKVPEDFLELVERKGEDPKWMTRSDLYQMLKT